MKLRIVPDKIIFALNGLLERSDRMINVSVCLSQDSTKNSTLAKNTITLIRSSLWHNKLSTVKYNKLPIQKYSMAKICTTLDDDKSMTFFQHE